MEIEFEHPNRPVYGLLGAKGLTLKRKSGTVYIGPYFPSYNTDNVITFSKTYTLWIENSSTNIIHLEVKSKSQLYHVQIRQYTRRIWRLPVALSDI